MTDTNKPTPLALASQAYALAFALNDTHMAGEPCHQAFRTAQAILLHAPLPGHWAATVHERVVSTGEFNEEDLTRYVLECHTADTGRCPPSCCTPDGPSCQEQR